MPSISQAIDHPKHTHCQQRLWLVAALGLFLDGLDLFIITLALPLITQSLHPSNWQIGLIAGAAPLGSVLGACVFGHLADRFGRKVLLLTNMLTFVGGALLSAAAWSIGSLLAFRFLLGLGVGMDFPISAAYMTENLPKHKRNKAMATAMLWNCLGSLGAILLSYALLLIYPQPNAWRLMLGATALPAVIAVILRLHLPESPRWLLATQQTQKASQAAAKLTGHTVKLPTLPRHKNVFSQQLLMITLLTSSIWLLHDITYYGLGMFTPSFFSTDSASHDSIKSVLTLAKSTAWVDIFIVLGALLSVLVIDKMSHTRLQIVGFLGTVVGLFCLYFAFAAPTPYSSALVIAGFISFNIFANMGPSITTYIIPAEAYPSAWRATGHGIAAAAGKFGAVLGVVLLPITQKNLGNDFLLAVLIGLSLLAILFTHYLAHPKTHRIDLAAYEA